MPIKIKTLLGKKLGLPGYSSKTASLEIEAEFAEMSLAHPHTLQKEIERLFEVAAQAVNAQLKGPAPDPAERKAAADEFRPATEPQIHALEEMCRARQIDLRFLISERYFVEEAEQLGRAQASELITWLQANKELPVTSPMRA